MLALAAPGSARAQTGPTVKSGFPIFIPESPSDRVHPVGSAIAVADLGLTAGFRSIVFGLRNGDLYVLSRSGGNWAVAAGWPQTLPAHVYSSPAVGDINNDGAPDIVVGYGSTIDNADGTPNLGGVLAFNRAGVPLWEVQTGDVTPPAGRDPVMATPAIGDVDGDGTMEVVFGALDHKLYVVNGENGQSNNPALWPRDMRDTVFSSAVLHDLDGDGGREIIVGRDSHVEPGVPNMVAGGCLEVLRFDGIVLAGFPKCVNEVISASPVVGDIDGDGRPEIVHGTGTFWAQTQTGFTPTRALYAWNCDGSAVAGWPVLLSGPSTGSPALANLDADPGLEVLATTNRVDAPPAGPGGNDVSEARLYRIEGNGAVTFNVQVRDFFAQSINAGDPLVGDVFDTTALDIAVTTNGEVALFRSTDGAQLTETDNFPDDPPPSLMLESPPSIAIADLETSGTGSLEIVAVAGGRTPPDVFPAPLTRTVVTAWIPVARTSTPPWGHFRQNERRTGVAPGTLACGSAAACVPDSSNARLFTITPCRALDTRQTGPVLTSSVRRTIAIGCGIPGTAKAVAVNVTVTQPTAAGFVRFAPGGCTALPVTSTINFSGGQTRANNAVLPLATDGSATLVAEAFVLAGGSVHLLVDVTGYFQ